MHERKRNMEKKDNSFLGTQPIGKLMMSLAIPTVTAQLINMLYNIVDRIYIGHIENVGSLALTGVGVCMPLIMIVSAFSCFAAFGGAPRTSIYLGQNDQDSAQKTLNNCFVLQIIISVTLSVFLFLFNRPLIMAFGGSVDTIQFAVDYMNIYSIGTLFVQLTLGMNAFITCQGFAKTGMLSVLIGALTNIVLDPILIFGLGLGVKGAAYATIISQAVSTVWVLMFLMGKKTTIRLNLSDMKLSKRYLGPVLALGISNFIMQSSESIISICFNASLQSYGGDLAVGAMTILTSVMQFAMLPLSGFGQGAQPIISYNYGARNGQRVKQAFSLLFKINTIFATVLWLVIELVPSVFARMFSPDPVLIEFTQSALRIYMGAVLLMGPLMACQITFTSLGKAKQSIMVAVTRKFILLIPLIYILPSVLPIDKTTSVYLAEPVADVLAVTFTLVLFSKVFKQTLKQISEA